MKNRRHRAIAKAQFYMDAYEDRKHWEPIFESVGLKYY